MAQDHVSQLIHSSITWLAKRFQAHYQTVSLPATETRVYKSTPISGGLFFSRNLKYGPKYAFAFFGSYSFLFNTVMLYMKSSSTVLAENLDLADNIATTALFYLVQACRLDIFLAT